nr:MAG TPA: hypothetical protein [Caudoviricetes sp.]
MSGSAGGGIPVPRHLIGLQSQPSLAWEPQGLVMPHRPHQTASWASRVGGHGFHEKCCCECV